MADEFRIVLGDACKSLSEPPGEPPEDDPDDLDMFLWHFLYENNRRIVVRIGTDELTAELDPDISCMALGLPKMVRALESGKKDWLSFSERGSEVAFVPESDTIWCRVHHWGETFERPLVSCPRDQVIGELWRFLDGLAEQAVAGGYLTEAQAKEFLGHELRPSALTRP
jgi:hypothetical protein